MGPLYVTDCDFGDGSDEAALLDAPVRVLHTRDPEEIARRAADAVGLFVQWAPIDDHLMGRLPRLRAIVRYGVGLDNIDLQAAERRGVHVFNVDDYCIDEVADHATALVLAGNRNLLSSDRRVKAGAWGNDGAAIRPPGEEIVGIVGLGRIGAAVAARCRGLGFPVHYYDPFAQDASAASIELVRHDSLEELAGASTHLSLHVPLSPRTQRIVDDGILDALGADGHLVNVSRGGLVDEEALLRALEEHRISHASLDVLATEPPTGVSRLIATHPRTTVTPHIAYASTAAASKLRRGAAERMRQGLR